MDKRIPEAMVHACPLFPRSGADKGLCLSQSQIVPKNEATCTVTRCTSKWRLCIVCMRQGFHNFAEAAVVDSVSGLCGFHQSHGALARREAVSNVRSKLIPERTKQVFTDQEHREDRPPGEADSPKDAPPAQVEVGKAMSKVRSASPTKPTSTVPVYTRASPKPKKTVAARDSEEDDKLLPEERLNAKLLIPMREREGMDGILVPTNRVRPMKGGQPREYFDQEALLELAGSIKSVGQLVPVLAYPISDDPSVDWEIEDGERRLRACVSIGKDLWIIPVGRTDYALQFARSAITNFGRLGHTVIEFARAIEFVGSKFGWSVKQIAIAFSVSPKTVVNHRRLLKLPAEVLALMGPDIAPEKQLTMAAVLPLVPYPEDFQKALARYISENGFTANEARRHIRRKARESGIKPRVGGRGRKPSDDFHAVTTKLQGISRRLTIILEESDKVIAEIFASRTPDDCMAVCDNLDRIIRKAEKIREIVDGGK